MKKDCHIYYLEMHDKATYPPNANNLSLSEVTKPISPRLFLDMYKRVGEHYKWTDRLAFSESELKQILDQDKTHIYRFYVNDEIVGFSELTVEASQVEILLFGLYPEAIGRGWGKQFLELIIEKAWSFNPPKVQLNTCDWDHPRALKNYLKAGFKEVKRIVKNQ